MNPATNRYINIGGRTYQKLFPESHKRNVEIARKIRTVTNRARKIDVASRAIDKKYDDVLVKQDIGPVPFKFDDDIPNGESKP